MEPVKKCVQDLRFLHWSLRIQIFWEITLCNYVQGDQKVPVHLLITIEKVTSNVQSVPRQSPNMY